MMIDEEDSKHLVYELRHLLGAAIIVSEFKNQPAIKIGNNINYFKDSAYVHTRNLYNFFLSKSNNDLKITKYLTNDFNLKLCIEWLEAINRHVLHISPDRNDPRNYINGKWLYDQIPAFAEDISQLWHEWIEATGVDDEKQQLVVVFEKAYSDAQADCDQLLGLIIKEDA